MNKGKITVSDIASAEKILGIEYSKQEREQMMNDLEDQIISAKTRRKSKFDNNVPTASKFDPRLPGFEMSNLTGLKISEKTYKCPSSDEDIAFASVAAQGHWIKTKQITSRRLTEIYLDRINKFQGQLNCYANVTGELALAEADAMDLLTEDYISLGPLHGIPYGLKDLFDTKDIETAWGAEPYQNRLPLEDAEIVKRLRAAGAVLLGKTAVGALAYNDIWYGGRTKNPWNLNEGSSGSSAGSASATAAGLCSFAIGTETLGSITSPSERCGTTGLRPTFGRVSRSGCMALCWSLDKIGPICRSVEDTGLILSIINGYDENDRFSVKAPFHFDSEKATSDLKVGYIPDSFGPDATELDKDILRVVSNLGFDVQAVELNKLPYSSLINILHAEAAASFEDLTLSNEDDTLAWQANEAWPNSFRKARFLSAVDHVQLDRLRYLVMKAMDDLFKDIDVLIGPFDVGPMLVASNFSGHPCLHLRVGFESLRTRMRIKSEKIDTKKKFKVPRGLSIWGPLFEEEKMLNFGMALEAQLNIADQKPTFAT